jgi:hypothetical protein
VSAFSAARFSCHNPRFANRATSRNNATVAGIDGLNDLDTFGVIFAYNLCWNETT